MEALLNGPYGSKQLGPNVTMLGRTPDNQVVVNDNKASTHHAEIRQIGQDYSITDLGSTNGTFVNGQQLSPTMPRTLISGDTVRIGDTTYTFETRNTQPPAAGMYGNQGPSSNPNYAPTQVAPPQYPGTVYGGSPSNNPPPQQATNYQQYPAQQPNSFPPPPQNAPPFNQYNQPTQASSYTPPPPPQYNVGQPYNPTPVPGTYQQGAGMPPYGVPPITPPKRGSGLRTIILAALALIVIIGAVATFFVVHNNQVAATNAQNTATAQTATAHSAATKVAIAMATGTAVVNATATANSASGDGPYAVGTVALTDSLKDNAGGSKWQEDSHCSFAQGIYEVKETTQNTFVSCLTTNTNFSNFSYRVALRILSGDCAGAVFRGDNNTNKQYYFEVCQTGTYALVAYNGTSGTYLVKPTTSSAIKTGTGSGAINVIAATANNDTLTLYANGTTLDTVQDATLTSGSIGVAAINDKSSGTDVGFADAKVWSI